LNTTTSKLGADMLTKEQIAAITDTYARRWNTTAAWNVKRCIENALIDALALLACQPAAIDKQAVAVVRDNPDDYGTIIEPIGDAVLPVGTELYAAPLANEASKPAPSVEQDQRGAFVIDSGAALKVAERFGFPLNAKTVEFAQAIVKRAGELQARAALTSANVAQGAKLSVWYGSMPESNGKTNWTAILHKGDIAEDITIDRSEYPDRVRYEADRMRWMIGEIDKEPWILDYDADKHSGYTAPPAQTALTADARDAARYRWLRDQGNSLETRQRDQGVVNGPSCYHDVEGIRELKWGDSLDKAIDAALAAAQSASGDTK